MAYVLQIVTFPPEEATSNPGRVNDAPASDASRLTLGCCCHLPRPLRREGRARVGRLPQAAELIRRIAYNDRGGELMAAASPTLRVQLLEAARSATEPLARAELLSAIARAFPN
jgi:hypothetical protein